MCAEESLGKSDLTPDCVGLPDIENRDGLTCTSSALIRT
jgi:hypothetical protein